MLLTILLIVFIAEKESASREVMQQVTVKNVKLFNDQVTFEIQEEIDGFKFVDKVKEAAKVKQFSMFISKFTAQVVELDELLRDYRNCRTTRFDQKALGLIFTDATFGIERVPYEAGEVIKDADGNDVVDDSGNPICHQRDGIDTNIKAVKLSRRAIKRLEDACAL